MCDNKVCSNKDGCACNETAPVACASCQVLLAEIERLKGERGVLREACKLMIGGDSEELLGGVMAHMVEEMKSTSHEDKQSALIGMAVVCALNATREV